MLALATVVGAPGTPARALRGPYEAVTTRIEVRLAERLSSHDAKAGALFSFRTTGSIMIAGRFLPAQTAGHGVVAVARPARGGAPGALVLVARSLDPSDGEPVEVGLEAGQLVARNRASDVVFDRGATFFVDAPPPPSPEPT